MRWAIAGTGQIAAGMALALTEIEDAEMVAVGSRTQEAADAFAADWSIPPGPWLVRGPGG